MRRRRQPLTVAMNGDRVGYLERITHGDLRFTYDPAWLERSDAIPISLSMPLSADPYTGDRVWNYFDNLLPDNEDLRERLQRSLGAESTRPFDLLAATGRDCVGALQLLDTSDVPNVRTVEAEPVSTAWIANRLQGLKTSPLGLIREDPEFRISIAGAQEKTALLWYRGSWHLPRGATPTTHILKRPIGPAANGIDLSDSIENEWLCLRILRAFGFHAAQAERESFDGVDALVVERFDRRWSKDGSWLIRLPQEDVCQALGLPPGKKYESDGGPGIRDVLQLLLQSRTAVMDRKTFFRSQVLFWMLAAIDGHAKNFSVFLESGGRFSLTPLYDVLSAHPIIARRQLAIKHTKMAMAVLGTSRHHRWKEIQRRHWVTTAIKSNFAEDQAREILDELAVRTPAVIEEVADSLPRDFPEDVSRPILDGLEQACRRLEP